MERGIKYLLLIGLILIPLNSFANEIEIYCPDGQEIGTITFGKTELPACMKFPCDLKEIDKCVQPIQYRVRLCKDNTKSQWDVKDVPFFRKSLVILSPSAVPSECYDPYSFKASNPPQPVELYPISRLCAKYCADDEGIPKQPCLKDCMECREGN